MLEQLALQKLADGRYYSTVSATSELELVMLDGRRERFVLRSTRPTEFTVREGAPTADGTGILEVEILHFEVAGVSQELWPGQTVKMAGGRNSGPEALPIYGVVRIPAGMSLEDGAYSEQEVYIRVDCPLGVLHNVEPVKMAATIKGIPPQEMFHNITGTIGLYGNHGLAVSATSCGSSTAPETK